MRISAIDIIKANKDISFNGKKQTTPPWGMDIFESCEPKPLITKKSVIKGKKLDKACFEPNIYEASLGIYKTRKVLNSEIEELEGIPSLELKISESNIGKASEFKKIEASDNVTADKLISNTTITLGGNTKVNNAITSLMTAEGSEINSLKCNSLTAKDSLIHYAEVYGSETGDKEKCLDLNNSKINILIINPEGEYNLDNSHICKIVIPKNSKLSDHPSISIKKNGDCVIGSFENNSSNPVTVDYYKDDKFTSSRQIPPNTVYDTDTLEKFFEE